MSHSRNSPWMIIVNGIEAAQNYVPFLFLYFLSQPRLDSSIGLVVTVLFVFFSFATAYSVIGHWLTRSYAFDAEGIRYLQGLFIKTETLLPWSAVAAIEVQRDPVRSIAGCCRVVVSASAGADQKIILDVVKCELVDALQLSSGIPVSREDPKSLSTETQPKAAETEGHIFSASQRDLLVMSLAYGRFALFVPVLAGTYLELAALLPALPDPERIIDRGVSGSTMVWVALISILVAASVAYGYAVTFLRFWRFRVRLIGESLQLEGGLMQRNRRTIPLDSVVGVSLRRNSFDLLTGRGRLALLTRDAGQVLGKNVVFPALKISDIEARMDSLDANAGALLAFERTPGNPPGAWLLAGMRVLVTVSLATAMLAGSGMWQHAEIVLAFVILLSVMIANSSFTTLIRDGDGKGILYRRGLLWRSSVYLPITEVHVFQSEVRPWDHWLGLRRTSLHYFAGGARRLLAWQTASSDIVIQPEADAA
ncbi:MAG: PH domain-containing protein [Actinobacteria bacterium]|nr:PH domain-containing protein [Actinomycetota bacterium]